MLRTDTRKPTPPVAPVEEEEEKVASVRYFENSFTSKVHHFYISTAIGDQHEYVDMIHRIKTAHQSDIVNIYLNTPGGILTTGIQLISAMKNSPAHIVAHMEGEVGSLGTIIFLSADEFVVNDHCMFMLHNFSHGSEGKGNEVASQVRAVNKWFEKFARDIYVPFLTEAEFDRLLKDEDFWFDSDEVRKRLNKMIKILNRQQKQKAKKLKD